MIENTILNHWLKYVRLHMNTFNNVDIAEIGKRT